MKAKSSYITLFLGVLSGVILLTVTNCKKENKEPAPQIQTGTVTDIDGNTYKTVLIGSQWWMAENLKVTRYRNGDSIPEVTDPLDWCRLTSGASCFYNDHLDNLLEYGRLYNWYAVSDSRNIAPEGWHVPALSDWDTLFYYLGGPDSDAGNRLKDKSFRSQSASSQPTNTTGFSALAAGYRDHNSGYYSANGGYTDWWSTTTNHDSIAWCWGVSWTSPWLMQSSNYKRTGLSVRCLKY